MLRNKGLLSLILTSVIFVGTLFASENGSEAFDGKPPCCVFLGAELPTALVRAFGGAQQIEFKLLGKVRWFRNFKMSVSVLAIIDKTLVRDVSAQEIAIEVTVPKYVAGYAPIKENDYMLLLPTKLYNNSLQENMYDFVKIPIGMLK